MFLFSTLLMEAPETSGKENKKSMTPEEHVSHYAQRKAAGARPAELKKLEHEAFKAFYSSSNEWKDYIAKMKVSDIAKQDAANFGFAQTKEGYLELSFTRTLRSITELREYLAKHPQNQLKAADLTPEIEQFIVRDFTKKSFKYGRVGYLRAKEGMTLEDIFNNVFDNYIQSIGGKEKYDPTQLDVVRQLAKDRVLSSLPQNAKKTLMSINREFQGYNHPESALFAIVAGAKDLYQRIKSSMENIMSTYKFPPIQTTPSIPSIQALPETSFSPKLDLVPKSTFNVSAETSAIEALSHTTNGFDNKQVVDNLMNFRLHKMNDLTKFFNEMKATGGKFTLVDENGNQKSFVLSDIIRDRDATGARRDFLLFIRNFKLERQNEMTITLGKNEYILKVDRKESGGTITLDTLKGQKIKFFASADNKTGIATATLDVPGFSIVADAKYYYDNAKRFTVENVNTTFNVGKQAILSISGTSLNFTPSQIFTFNKNDPFKSTITIGGDNPSALARKTISLQQLVGNDPQTAALRRQAWAAIVNNLGENAMISIGATIGSAQTKITAGVDISKDNLQHGYQRIRGPGRVGASLTLAGVNVGVANVANLSVENSTFTYYTGSGGTYAGWSDASGNELMGVSSSITKKELNDAGISKVIETAHKLKDQIELAWKSGNIKQMKTDWVKARDNILHNLWNVYDALPEDTNLRISLSNLLPHV
ncbi:hypothetical protein FJZ26_02100, partial [Candidatus Parvarchaeota archaeon]|nr:hypothetical protein [Candidatus Parvarchaeota archaeon]